MPATRGTVTYEDNRQNSMGLEFYDLSHPWGSGQSCWPYGEDSKVRRSYSMSRSGMLTQKITTMMHSGTHLDAPAHMVEGKPCIDEIPLPRFFGSGVVVSIAKPRWGFITRDDLERAAPAIAEGDIVVVNTGWHRLYGDSRQYYAYAPGLDKSAGEWLVGMKVKLVGMDTASLDHPLATTIGPHGPGWPGGLLPQVNVEYEAQYKTRVIDDFPEWEPCQRALFTAGICALENVGGEIDAVTGRRVTFAAFPWRWTQGDGCIVRLVAIVDPHGKYHIEAGSVAGSTATPRMHTDGQTERALPAQRGL